MSAALLAGAATVVLIALGVVWVVLSHSRASYDAYGWMVWGKQVLHWNLNTDAAPSWKPLTFLFTLPYALFGSAQPSLWAVTASAAALSSGLFAGRIAYRLTGPAEPGWSPSRRARVVSVFPAVVAAVFAGLGVLGMSGYSHQMMITTSDPMDVALCLAAIDALLCRRHGLAFLAVVLASLGRPEAWPLAGLYGLWLLRRVPGMRPWVVLGGLFILASWFVIPGLTSKSWFSAGKLAEHTPQVIHGDVLSGVLNRFLGIYELPMQLAVLGGVAVAVLVRDRRVLGMTLAAVLWVVIEYILAVDGFSASQRYMLEAAAVLVVVAGVGIGRALRAFVEDGSWLSWLGTAAALAVIVALLPVAQQRINLLQSQVNRAQFIAARISHLQQLVARLGGLTGVQACGHPVTIVGFQSTLAWDLGLNVGKVGYLPGREIRKGIPIVLFKPSGTGWTVHPIHFRRAQRAVCERMHFVYQ